MATHTVQIGSIERAIDARRILEPKPRFADPQHIEARRFLDLYNVARQCLQIECFCLCRNGCYERSHWGAMLDAHLLARMNRGQLVEVVKRLWLLGYIELGEALEVCTGIEFLDAAV